MKLEITRYFETPIYIMFLVVKSFARKIVRVKINKINDFKFCERAFKSNFCFSWPLDLINPLRHFSGIKRENNWPSLVHCSPQETIAGAKSSLITSLCHSRKTPLKYRFKAEHATIFALYNFDSLCCLHEIVFVLKCHVSWK